MTPTSPSFSQLDDAVFVHTSSRSMTTTTVIGLDAGTCMIVDPAMEPSDLASVAQLLEDRALVPLCGWSTHAHWDHVLWSHRLGAEVPRFAVRANVDVCAAELPELQAYIEEQCPGHDLELCGALRPLDEAGSLWPASCVVIEHRAHAPGHAALWIEERGLLVAGDMVSDIEIPTVDLDQPDPFSDYDAALDLYAAVAPQVSAFVPGHGRPGDSAELSRRLDLDRKYLDDVASGHPLTDERCREDWLKQQHERQVRWWQER